MDLLAERQPIQCRCVDTTSHQNGVPIPNDLQKRFPILLRPAVPRIMLTDLKLLHVIARGLACLSALIGTLLCLNAHGS